MSARELAAILAAIEAAPRVGRGGYVLVADVERLSGLERAAWPMRYRITGPRVRPSRELPPQSCVMPGCEEVIRDELERLRLGERRPKAPRPREVYAVPEVEGAARVHDLLARLVAVAATLPLLPDGGIIADDLERLSGIARKRWPVGWFQTGPKLRLPRVRRGEPGRLVRCVYPGEVDRARAEVERVRLALVSQPREDDVEVGALPGPDLARALSTLRWSQGRLAQALGVPYALVHRWVHARAPVPDWAARHVRFFLRQQAERAAGG